MTPPPPHPKYACAGCTALHYAHAYGHGATLGEYLVSKGADDSVTNQEGLTCYEGLHKDTVDDI